MGKDSFHLRHNKFDGLMCYLSRDVQEAVVNVDLNSGVRYEVGLDISRQR